MTKWAVSFVIDSGKFSEMMEKLVPMKIEGLDFKIVAGTAKHIRPGDKAAWEVVASMATDKPLPMAHFRDGMRARGFPNGTIYGALSTALEHHVLRKVMVKGVTHYVKEKTR